jgi:hypothetical protein
VRKAASEVAFPYAVDDCCFHRRDSRLVSRLALSPRPASEIFRST